MIRSCFLTIAMLMTIVGPASAQSRGAAALSGAVDGLAVTTRVLMIGAHPDDEDTNLIAWLARGRQVETAYLSLTRGDGGQNLIGNELGEGLGAIRTEELLAAREVDGARQYFTRAFDFGFSKTAEETFQHWQRDTVLGDVVRVVRAFRPQVIIAVFTGTPRDGHGHHQVSGILAREAYDLAADTTRFPVASYGQPWEPLEFYRARRGNAEGATVGMNAGEYDPVLGRSYAEVAGESRSQHKSQGFGALEPKGRLLTHVLREASRVEIPADAERRSLLERSIFDGIDTSLVAIAGPSATPAVRAQLDSMASALASARTALDLRDPATVYPALRDAGSHLAAACGVAPTLCDMRMERRETANGSVRVAPAPENPTLMDAMGQLTERHYTAVAQAAGVAVEAQVGRELTVVGRDVPVDVRIYNRGTHPIRLRQVLLADGQGGATRPMAFADSTSDPSLVPPGEMRRMRAMYRLDAPSSPWWLEGGRSGDMFVTPIVDDFLRVRSDVGSYAWVVFEVDGEPQGAPPTGLASADLIGMVTEPVVYRYADPVRGEVRRPLAAVPAISVTLDRPLELLPANQDVERTVRVQLRSADTLARSATVKLQLPRGLTPDSSSRTVTLSGYDALATVDFTVRGRMAPGRDTIRVMVESNGESFDNGYQLVDYPHIRPQRLYHPAVLALEAVDVAVPGSLTVGYVPGVGDNVAPALAELGIPVTVINPTDLPAADLSRYTTVVVGPRAYDAYPEVMASRGKLLDFARNGGTLVVQYQQYAVQAPGVVPYPMTVARPHDRVTIEDAPVTVLDAASALLTGPNRIAPTDFDGWVQERSLYMPRTFDPRYAAPLEMHDPDEPEQRGALLSAPLGDGMYVYTAISFFRQLPAGVPGATRMFVNLLAARASR